jgi:hypothetical protein
MVQNTIDNIIVQKALPPESKGGPFRGPAGTFGAAGIIAEGFPPSQPR